MKKSFSVFAVYALAVFVQQHISAQCASRVQLATSSNIFTHIRNGNHSIAVDKSMNMAVFIHRQDIGIHGGSSGTLRFDHSLNGGTTWTIDAGAINPANSSPARYPNVAIYNPVNNTNPANVYISYMAPTLSSVTLNTWNGVVTGVSQLNVTGVTETYNQNGIGNIQVPHSLCKGAPGVMWAIDPMAAPTGGYYIYKGVWNNLANDFVWNYNFTIAPPFYPGLTTYPPFMDYNIAFDPTGQIGWVCFMSHVTVPNGPTAPGLYPVLYNTTDGGLNWNGPIQVDVTKFGCITSNIQPGSVASCNRDHDLIVDANGNPHIITTLGSAASYNFNYAAWHRMYDITRTNGFWVAHELGNVNGGFITIGTAPNTADWAQAPQSGRTADGTKIFFSWTDNSNYTLGAPNANPNIYTKGYDILLNMWTPTKEVTSCNANTSGQVLFPRMAMEMLEPAIGQYKLPIVYGENVVPNDLVQTAQFYFLDNVIFSASDFSIAPPTATVAIQEAPLAVICPNSTVSLSISGNPGQVLWNTGATTPTIAISGGTATAYSASAQVGCQVGTASVAVLNLTVNPTVITPSVCPGALASFSVDGNALSYQWSPGTQTGSSVSLLPSSPVVTVFAKGTGGCTSQFTLGVTIIPQPTIQIAGNSTVCAGVPFTLTASGAQTYTWSTGVMSNSIITSVPSSSVIFVDGTAANTCTGTGQFSFTAVQPPILTTGSSQQQICAGSSVTLVAFGASDYTWSTGAPGNTVSVSPTVTSEFTVTGVNMDGCAAEAVVTITVHPAPTLSLSVNRPDICEGDRIILTVSGAQQYTWAQPGSTSPTVQVYVKSNSNYTVTGRNTFGCATTSNFSLAVDACTGIVDQRARGIVVSPNPSAGEFVISSVNTSDIVIINLSGQIVRKLELPSNGKVNVNLPPGVYLLHASNFSPLKIVVTD